MRTPQRQTVDTTIGAGIVSPTPSTSALAPNVGLGVGGGIVVLAVAGADSQLATPLSYTSTVHTNIFTTSFTVPLPNMPAPFTPASADALRMLVNGFIATAAFDIGIVMNQKLVPQGATRNNGILFGPNFQTGVTYVGWSVAVTLNLYCPGGAAPTDTVYQVNAVLYDAPG